MKEEKLGRKTSPGFADPNSAVRLDTPVHVAVQVPRAAPVPVLNVAPPPPAASEPPMSNAQRRSKVARPMVDVEVIHERSRVPRPPPFSGCYEIWTQNNVYAIDARMRCVEVRERGSGDVRGDHPFLNARLVGGQFQQDSMEMSYPLPRPGSFAVFEMKKNNRRQFTRTSAVERVVLRMRIVTIADASIAPPWESFTEADE
jgi:hypothetical protein